MATTSLSSSLLDSFSQISAQSRCDNCKDVMDQVSWQQCKICKIFDLCRTCATSYDKLEPDTLRRHNDNHKQAGHPEPNFKDMDLVLVGEFERTGHDSLNRMIVYHFKEIMKNEKIENDYEMRIVLGMLEKKVPQGNTSLSAPEEEERSKCGSMIVEYNIQAYKRRVHILSLDGGGVRGYMSIKVLWQLIMDNYLPDIKSFDVNDKEYQEKFKQGQLKFTDNFDYFVGTSTGGLIALCLATKYPILEIQKIYGNSQDYFTKNWLNGSRWFSMLGDIMSAKYNHTNIHKKIDQVIDEIFEGKLDDGKPLTAENATLLDLHNLLNPHHMINDDAFKLNRQYHGNLLEFVSDKPSTTDCKVTDCNKLHEGKNPHCVQREKVLLINAYDTTTSSVTVFNTSYAEHWQYRIADVLKATMAAPTYFQPWPMCKGRKENGTFVKDNQTHVFIDGGVYANDPELTALWAIRMQWKKMVHYHLLSIGTGCYNPKLSSSSWGGYYTWLFDRSKTGLVIDTLMDATRSFTETIASNLAKYNNIRRMKFNYKLTQPLNLDDSDFPKKLEAEWKRLKEQPDYKALCYFYDTYIKK